VIENSAVSSKNLKLEFKKQLTTPSKNFKVSRKSLTRSTSDSTYTSLINFPILVMAGFCYRQLKYAIITQSKMLPPQRRICCVVCLSVSLLATLHKNFRTDLHKRAVPVILVVYIYHVQLIKLNMKFPLLDSLATIYALCEY